MAMNQTIANDHLMSDEEKAKYSDTPKVDTPKVEKKEIEKKDKK